MAYAFDDNAQKFVSAKGAQGAPLQTQSVHTVLTLRCTTCECLHEIATGAKRPRNDKSGGLCGFYSVNMAVER